MRAALAPCRESSLSRTRDLDTIKTQQTLARVFAGSGAMLAAVGGIVLGIAHMSSEHEPATAQVSMACLPSHCALTLSVAAACGLSIDPSLDGKRCDSLTAFDGATAHHACRRRRGRDRAADHSRTARDDDAEYPHPPALPHRRLRPPP